MTKADEYATFVRPMGYKTGQLFRFDLGDVDANVAFEPDGLLKAGTFSKLVEKMTGKNAGANLLCRTLPRWCRRWARFILFRHSLPGFLVSFFTNCLPNCRSYINFRIVVDLSLILHAVGTAGRFGPEISALPLLYSAFLPNILNISHICDSSSS